MGGEELVVEGVSPAWRRVKDAIDEAGRTDAPVLLVGERGSGKELLARTIHRNGRRGDAPFRSVDCADLPEQLLHSELFGHLRDGFPGARRDKRGMVERLDGGCLLLKELRTVGPVLTRLLHRFARSGEVHPIGADRPVGTVDVRMMWTSVAPIDPSLRAGLDLIEIAVPPLRERSEDVEVLAAHFLAQIQERRQSPRAVLRGDTLERLRRYSWPGNVRELRSVIEFAALVHGNSEIAPNHLPLELQ